MTRDMDQICTTVIIAAAVILLCMGYVEMSKMHLRTNGSTCGRKTQVSTPEPPKVVGSGVSAKVSQPTDVQKQVEEGKYNSIDSGWDMDIPGVDPSKECQYKEQDQKIDIAQFFDPFPEDAKLVEQFEKGRPDVTKAMISANARGSLMQTLDAPKMTKNLGIPGLKDTIMPPTPKISCGGKPIDMMVNDSYLTACQQSSN